MISITNARGACKELPKNEQTRKANFENALANLHSIPRWDNIQISPVYIWLLETRHLRMENTEKGQGTFLDKRFIHCDNEYN